MALRVHVVSRCRARLLSRAAVTAFNRRVVRQKKPGQAKGCTFPTDSCKFPTENIMHAPKI